MPAAAADTTATAPDAPAADAPAPAPVPPALHTARERFLRHVAVERGLAANTVAAYRRDLDGYLAYLARNGVAHPAEVGAPLVGAYAAELGGAQALAASSRARMLSTVRGFHRFLVDEGVTVEDAAADARPPKLPTRLPKALSIEQVAAILDGVPVDTPVGLRDRALLELLYATGARVSEATGLVVDDVRGDDGSAVPLLRLLGKGGKQRIVPVGGLARAALDAYLVRGRPALAPHGRSTPALFLGRRGAPLSRQSAWAVIRTAAERAHLDVDVSPHTLRHSFATHLLTGGADVRVVQELLGHASVATTQIYTLVTADALRDVYTTAHPRAR
jgi:integrase/recombinase XerD